MFSRLPLRILVAVNQVAETRAHNTSSHELHRIPPVSRPDRLSHLLPWAIIGERGGGSGRDDGSDTQIPGSLVLLLHTPHLAVGQVYPTSQKFAYLGKGLGPAPLRISGIEEASPPRQNCPATCTSILRVRDHRSGSTMITYQASCNREA